jgi:hypothetical protein
MPPANRAVPILHDITPVETYYVWVFGNRLGGTHQIRYPLMVNPKETAWTKSTPRDEKRTYFQGSLMSISYHK